MFWSRCAWRFAHTKVAAMKLEMSYGPNFDVQLKKSVLIIRILTVGEHDWLVVGRTWSVSSQMEVCVCFLACFLTCAAGVTSDPEEIRRGMLYPSNRTVARWQTQVLRAERVCLVFLRQMEDPVKALTEIRLWGGGIDRWWSLPPSQRRRSKHLQSRASITQREEEWTQIMSLPWCSALIWLTCAVEFDIITAGNDQIIGLETHLYSFCKVLRSFSYRRLECCRFMSTFSIKVVDYVAFNTTGNVYCNNSDKTLIFYTLTNRYDHIFHST